MVTGWAFLFSAVANSLAGFVVRTDESWLGQTVRQR